MPETKKEPKKHNYNGWRKDHPDSRDFIYHAGQDMKREVKKAEVVETGAWDDFVTWLKNSFCPKPTPPPTPPTPTPPVNNHVDLRPQDSPIEDQGDLGSCTANAWAGALQFLEIKDGLQEKTGGLNFSRLFIYWNERAIEGTTSTDSGAELRDGASTLASQGSCYEATWAYDISKFVVQPPANAYTEGTQHEITQYFRITTLADIKACLDAGFPFVFGFTVYSSFESDVVAQTGVVPMPGPNESILGGHAVMCLGYDDASQRFICRNSWGSSWGQKGYFTIPYAYLINSNLASDFWTVRKGMNMLA
jgi:C1A family cysteine protease